VTGLCLARRAIAGPATALRTAAADASAMAKRIPSRVAKPCAPIMQHPLIAKNPKVGAVCQNETPASKPGDRDGTSEPVDGGDANAQRNAEALRERVGSHAGAVPRGGVLGHPGRVLSRARTGFVHLSRT